ncbi:sorbitol dehydrogenase [Xylariomycetidae sp. FL0641]|nr:sorbitol dehydrogenase [Xylariomycetidae sp. FL0641]
MAPAATVEIAPMQLPVHSKGSKITASVLHGPQDLRLEVRSIEEPGVGELQIAVKSTGICGSDVSYYKKFANGDLCACAPLSLGHESSGTVVGIGPQVAGFKIGDRVALEVGIPCGQCSICRKGRYNLCKKMRFRSSAKSVPHFQGTLQERINHPAVWCHKLPDHVSFEAAALLEPLSVAIHAVNRASPIPGSTAMVMGAGTVGLLTAAMARQSGCPSVTIADVDAGRVDYAVKRGFATHGYVVPRAHHPSPGSASGSAHSSGASTPVTAGAATPSSIFSDTIPGRLESARGLAAEILAASYEGSLSSRSSSDEDEEDEDEDEHAGFDVVFECTGKEACVQASVYAARPGGRVALVGMGTPVQTLPVSAAQLREVDLVGVFRYANTYAAGIRLLPALPSLDAMVTHRFRGLAAAPRAFELAARTADEHGNLVLKVVIEA